MDQITEWTQTINRDGVEFSVNATGTHVTVSTIYGQLTESVVNIESKLKDHDLLPAVRSMYKSMLAYYKKDQKK